MMNKLIETFAREYDEIKMSVIFQIFHKNKGNSRAIGHIFRGNLGNLSHFISVISFVQRSLIIGLLLSILLPSVAGATTPVIEIKIRNHLFYPSTVPVPANTKVKLLVINEDATSEEFESYELNREKVIMGKRKAVIFIGPLAPGEYPFFGEFYPQTAQGKVIAK